MRKAHNPTVAWTGNLRRPGTTDVTRLDSSEIDFDTAVALDDISDCEIFFGSLFHLCLKDPSSAYFWKYHICTRLRGRFLLPKMRTSFRTKYNWSGILLLRSEMEYKG